MKKTRTKTKDGKFVTKRYDTKIKTIEKKYNIDLGVRGDMKLGNYLKNQGYPSLAQMLKE
jgi:hypothetical protein